MTSQEFASSYLDYISNTARLSDISEYADFSLELRNHWQTIDIDEHQKELFRDNINDSRYTFLFNGILSKYYCVMTGPSTPRIIRCINKNIWQYSPPPPIQVYDLLPDHPYDFLREEKEDLDEHISFTPEEVLEFISAY